jgi:RNA polymerase sigma-70 factor (ECF subfamily)
MPTLDRSAFEDCYRRVFPLVLAKCRRMLRGDADAMDVTQEVFVRLWRHRDVVEDHAALTAWLYRTSTRLVIDRARQRALSQESLRHLVLALEEPAGHDSEARFSSRRQLRSVLSECHPGELEAAILSRLDRLTHPEIAEVVGVGERTVRRLLGRFDERVSALKELQG